MAVAHESATESHTGTTGSASEAFFDISVPFTSSSKSLLVYTFVLGASGDLATSVKIDPAGANTDVPAVSGGRATDTAGEVGDCKAWFLGSGLPTTTTTVRVNRTNNADVMYAVAITDTAGTDTETTGVVLLQEDGTLAEQSVDDGSPGTNSVRYAGLYSGLTDTGTTIVGANSTSLHFIDLGPRGAHVVRETTAGQGSRSVGFTSAGSDDRAAVHLAVREVAGGGVTGTVAVTQADQTSAASGAVTMTGTSATTQADQTSTASGAVTMTGTVAVTQEDQTSTASGTVGDTITGSVAVTQADQTSAASGAITFTGTAAPTQANQTSAASGTVANPVTGTVAVTQDNQTASASGSATDVVFTFTPPVNDERQIGTRKPFWFYDIGTPKSVLIEAGVVSETFLPDMDRINAADSGSGYADRAVFLGGRSWTITAAEKAILEAAGYTVT